MRIIKQALKNKKGFTLVEIMISIAALGIVCAVLLRLFVLAGSTNDTASDAQNAQLYASSTIETIMSADTVDEGMQALGLQFSPQLNEYTHQDGDNNAVIAIADTGGDYPGTLWQITVTVPGEDKPLSQIVTKKYELVSADD
jgi:prepilin-type N-terminal cleavage/methylation domain-containing protein